MALPAWMTRSRADTASRLSPDADPALSWRKHLKGVASTQQQPSDEKAQALAIKIVHLLKNDDAAKRDYIEMPATNLEPDHDHIEIDTTNYHDALKKFTRGYMPLLNGMQRNVLEEEVSGIVYNAVYQLAKKVAGVINVSDLRLQEPKFLFDRVKRQIELNVQQALDASQGVDFPKHMQTFMLPDKAYSSGLLEEKLLNQRVEMIERFLQSLGREDASGKTLGQQFTNRAAMQPVSDNLHDAMKTAIQTNGKNITPAYASVMLKRAIGSYVLENATDPEWEALLQKTPRQLLQEIIAIQQSKAAESSHTAPMGR